MKYPDLNSANSYLFTLEWRKYFWVFDLFGSFIRNFYQTISQSLEYEYLLITKVSGSKYQFFLLVRPRKLSKCDG